MKEIVEREDWNNWNENLFKLSSFRDDNSSVFNIRFKTESAGIKFLKLEGKFFKEVKTTDRFCIFLHRRSYNTGQRCNCSLNKRGPYDSLEKFYGQNFNRKKAGAGYQGPGQIKQRPGRIRLRHQPRPAGTASKNYFFQHNACSKVQ
jgi:hypothetical protein